MIQQRPEVVLAAQSNRKLVGELLPHTILRLSTKLNGRGMFSRRGVQPVIEPEFYVWNNRERATAGVREVTLCRKTHK